MEKIKIGNTYGYSDFITDEEKDVLLKWVKSNHDKFRNNQYGSNRKFGIIDEFEYFPSLVNELKKKIIYLEKIQDYLEEPYFRDYIGINTEGGYVHYHKDPNQNNYINTRYNIILSYPEKGGESIYDGRVNKLFEKLIWKCVAGKFFHGSVPVIGKKPRITLSLGFLIREN